MDQKEFYKLPGSRGFLPIWSQEEKPYSKSQTELQKNINPEIEVPFKLLDNVQPVKLIKS